LKKESTLLLNRDNAPNFTVDLILSLIETDVSKRPIVAALIEEVKTEEDLGQD
jgi:hypothetical protein